MKRIFLFTLIISALFSCNNATSLKEKELRLKEKELQLKEKELEIQQKQQTAQTENILNKEADNQLFNNNETRKLRYVFYSNGGIIGYFNDGTVARCPGCDLMKETIQTLYTEKPFKTYVVREDGSLLVNGSEVEIPKTINEIGDNDWAMIDYKWLVDLDNL